MAGNLPLGSMDALPSDRRGRACSDSLMSNGNSLFRRISSLFHQKFSLFDRVGNSIKKANEYTLLRRSIMDEKPRNRENSLYFPWITGNQPWRIVRLRPPPASRLVLQRKRASADSWVLLSGNVTARMQVRPRRCQLASSARPNPSQTFKSNQDRDAILVHCSSRAQVEDKKAPPLWKEAGLQQSNKWTCGSDMSPILSAGLPTNA
jgi:hypothetical protein